MIAPVNHNAESLAARFALSKNMQSLRTSFERLSTGRKINSGKDDPAGLISGELLSAELASLQAETESLQRADANANVTSGYLSSMSSMMGDLSGLVVAGANTAGVSDAERDAYQMQIDGIVDNLQRFGGSAVESLDGFSMPDDGNADVETLISGAVGSLADLKSGGSYSLNNSDLETAQQIVHDAVVDVASAAGAIGGFQAYTLDTAIRSNEIAVENVSDSRSQILEPDFAVEVSSLLRSEILTKSNLKVLSLVNDKAGAIQRLLDPIP